jgi:hypothetical protein
MGKPRAEVTKGRALALAEERGPGSKVGRCRSNGAFPSVASTILSAFQ